MEEAVAARIGASAPVFEQKRLDLEQATEADVLSVRRALPAFADLKAPMMAAKVDQIAATTACTRPSRSSNGFGANSTARPTWSSHNWMCRIRSLADPTLP